MYRKSEANAQPPTKDPKLIYDGPSSGPSWIVSCAPDSNQDQVNSEVPFGYVDPEMKGYFRTVEGQLKGCQQNLGEAETVEYTNSTKHAGFTLLVDKRVFLMAAL
ncbi:hypothetical protein BJY52DRAFT_1306660 [Lactarius psammicola]|nr:hypothetical protein BJY52DRAFT_1306660 [Lactarius psammicola]